MTQPGILPVCHAAKIQFNHHLIGAGAEKYALSQGIAGLQQIAVFPTAQTRATAANRVARQVTTYRPAADNSTPIEASKVVSLKSSSVCGTILDVPATGFFP